MRKRLRFFAGCMAVCLLAGCSPAVSKPESSTSSETTIHTGTIAYVPLDDRPDNVERVEYLAESLGYKLDMPDTDLYKTCLDGQPTNADGTQYGNRGALYEWVLAEEKAGCNLYILSLDQLLSGGLVNSRHMTESESATLSDGVKLSEDTLLLSLLKTLHADQNNQVWLLDTVMRLAPTMGYAGFDLDGYNALRAYGMEPRPTLSGSSLTVNNIVSDYALDADGTLLPIPSGTPLDTGIIQDYLNARERKLRLSDLLLSTLTKPGYEKFHVLIGIDDSSAEDSIQKNEISYLRQNLRSGDWLLSGVDDLAFKAVTKLYLAGSGWTGATACVTYFGGTEREAACDYDYRPLEDLVDEHLAFFGLNACTNPQAADLQILVLTRPSDGVKKESVYQALINQLNKNKNQQRPTILIDAGNGQYGTAFHDALVKQSNLGWLLSYSGFLDMAIVSGTALSLGVARFAWLQSGNGRDETANKAFIKTLADSVIKDFCYKNTVREDLISYVRNELGGSADNFYHPKIDLDAVQAQLEDGMQQSTKRVLQNFANSNLIVSLNPYAEAGYGKLSLSNYSFPWYRVFEIRMDFNVNDLTKIHKKFLFFYLF